MIREIAIESIPGTPLLMTPFFKTLPIFLLLAACGDGQPFFDNGADGDTVTDGVVPGDNDEVQDGISFVSSGGLPPGTADPRASGSIIRFEERDGQGGGLVTDAEYRGDSDTFRVDNLGFDGENIYQRFGSLPTLGGYSVYVADFVTPDSLTGAPIGQIVPYHVLYGASDTNFDGEDRASFAIVRSGGYIDFGFGGYIYQRRGPVNLPATGQAGFAGRYAGMRTSTNQSGLIFTRGDLDIAIDFEDFNANAAVRGVLDNRAFFDEDGDEIPVGGPGQPIAPPVTFVVQEGAPSITVNGEIIGELGNTILRDGTRQIYESGTYQGIIAGDLNDINDGGEIVGVIVINSEDLDVDGVSNRETGGFLLQRVRN